MTFKIIKPKTASDYWGHTKSQIPCEDIYISYTINISINPRHYPIFRQGTWSLERSSNSLKDAQLVTEGFFQTPQDTASFRKWWTLSHCMVCHYSPQHGLTPFLSWSPSFSTPNSVNSHPCSHHSPQLQLLLKSECCQNHSSFGTIAICSGS